MCLHCGEVLKTNGKSNIAKLTPNNGTSAENIGKLFVCKRCRCLAYAYFTLTCATPNQAAVPTTQLSMLLLTCLMFKQLHCSPNTYGGGGWKRPLQVSPLEI